MEALSLATRGQKRPAERLVPAERAGRRASFQLHHLRTANVSGCVLGPH